MPHYRQTFFQDKQRADALKQEAAERSAAAKSSITGLGQVLISVVEASPVFEIAKQKNVSTFNEHQPEPPKYSDYPREPKRQD